jgi:hypothetical protein
LCTQSLALQDATVDVAGDFLSIGLAIWASTERFADYHLSGNIVRKSETIKGA